MLKSKTIGLAALAAALVLTVSSCANAAGASEQTTATTQAAATTVPGTVAIDLGDGGGTMYLTPAVSTAPAGTVTFSITNSGTIEHEFVVLKTDLAAAAMPMEDNGQQAVEDGDGVTHIDEIESILPGETKTLTVDLEAGHYVLVCNLPGHYKMGMVADFAVQ